MKRLMMILSILLMVSVLGFGQIDLQPVATVRLFESEQISVGDFKNYVRYAVIMQTGSFQNISLPEIPANDRRTALTAMGDLYLAAQAAKKANTRLTKQELDKAFEPVVEGLSSHLGGRKLTTPKEIDDELKKATGISADLFKKFMERELLAQRYLQPKLEDRARNVKQPTDREIQSRYNELKDKTIFEGGFTQPDNIQVRMLGATFRNAGEKTTAQTTINNLSRQIGRDANQFDAADRDSLKINSPYRGADDIVYNHEYYRKNLGEAFVDAVFRLKQGEISGVLEVPNGFCIIKVIKVLRARPLAMDDVIATVPDPQNQNRPRPVTVRDVIVQRESMQRLSEIQNQVIGELGEEIKKNSGSVQIIEDTYSKITW